MNLVQKKILGGVVGAVAGFAFVLLGLRYSLLSGLENTSWDWIQKKIATAKIADPKIKIIRIDQPSIDSIANEEKYFWPWPREYYAAVIEFLRQGKAKAIAFDMLFTEPSSYGPGDDEAFASSLNGTPPVVSAVVPSEASRISRPLDPSLLSRVSLSYDAEVVKHFTKFKSIMLPIEPLIKKSWGLGSVQADPDSDGVFRRAPIGASNANLNVPSLAFSLYLAGGGAPSIIRQFSDRERVVRFPLNTAAYQTFSIADVIRSYARISNGEKPLIDPSIFTDCYVIVGISAPGLSDIRPTPVDEKAPGYFFHAATLDNILHQDFANVPSGWIVLFPIFLCLVVGILGIQWAPTITAQLLSVIVVLSLLGVEYYERMLYNTWSPLIVPFLGISGSFLFVQLVRYYLEGSEKRFLTEAFQRYVSPDVINDLIADPKRLGIGGERRELSIMFIDIKKFSKIAEHLDASRLAILLNIFLTEMTDIIMRHRGTVDKFVGDGIVAFWNAPVPYPEHAAAAVRAAIECQTRLVDLRERFKSEFGAEIFIRIGINTGDVSVGNFGSASRFSYTIIGDAANFASRLEGVNKVFGTGTLVSQSTRDACPKEVKFRKVADVQVVGKSEIGSVYEPLESNSQSHERFSQALELFERGERVAAKAIFDELSDDPVASAYSARISQEADLKPWSHIWVQTEK